MKSPTIVLAILLAATLGAPRPSAGYAIKTHELISAEAVEQQANLTRHLDVLGLESITQKLHAQVEPIGPDRSPIDWIRQGARREDDLLPIARFRNHFHDPVHDRGLAFATDCGFTIGGHASTDWGLETGGVSQSYSFRDARERFYVAMTDPDRETRTTFLAAMFRTLGQVIHLIQDAAQPQHTRNDAHGPGWLCAGGDQEYEEFVGGKVLEGPDPLALQGYPVVRFESEANLPRSFWTTPDGRGLADYSNRGFVSAKTNFERRHCPDGYAEPVPEDEHVIGEGEEICEDLGVDPIRGPDGLSLPCRMAFVRNTVVDRYDPEQTARNEFAAATSIVDADVAALAGSGDATCPLSRLYAVNPITFEHAQRLLIPRAVGYSAGLLDYFFRGELRAGDDLENPGNLLVENAGDEAMSGTFEIYYDDVVGRRHLVAQFGAADDPVTLEPHGSEASRISLPITEPTVPLAERAGEYLVVFKGRLGVEGTPDGADGYAVAAAVGRICHPRVMDLGSFAGPDWQATYPPALGNLGFVGQIQPEAGAVGWLSDECCTSGDIDDNSILNYRTTYYEGSESSLTRSGVYDPPLEHYLRFRVGERCGVRLEATVEITNVPFESSGFWVGGEILPIRATPALELGEPRLDLPPAEFAEGSRARAIPTWKGTRVPVITAFESRNTIGDFGVDDDDVYPRFSDVYRVSTELAWSSQDPATGEPLNWRSGAFVPGVPAVPYWTASHPYLGIFFEATDFGVSDENGAYNGVRLATIRDFTVTVFPLAGIDPPILTEDD